MKITVKFENEELVRTDMALKEIGKEFDGNVQQLSNYDEIYEDYGAIKIQSKEASSYDIDIDSKFVYWLLKKSARFARIVKSIYDFFDDFFDNLLEDIGSFFKDEFDYRYVMIDGTIKTPSIDKKREKLEKEHRKLIEKELNSYITKKEGSKEKEQTDSDSTYSSLDGNYHYSVNTGNNNSVDIDTTSSITKILDLE